MKRRDFIKNAFYGLAGLTLVGKYAVSIFHEQEEKIAIEKKLATTNSNEAIQAKNVILTINGQRIEPFDTTVYLERS